MITNIDEQTLNFLVKKKLTFNQFCMCLMIYHQNAVGIIKYTNEIGYLTGGTVMKPDKTVINELDDLLKRAFVRHNFIDKSDYFSLDNFVVTDKFTAGFLDKFDDYCKELWTEYPKEGMVGNNTFAAKSVDYDEFKEKYISILKGDISIHDINMSRLREYKKSHQYAEMGIMKYIGSRHWENLTNDAKPKLRFH